MGNSVCQLDNQEGDEARLNRQKSLVFLSNLGERKSWKQLFLSYCIHIVCTNSAAFLCIWLGCYMLFVQNSGQVS